MGRKWDRADDGDLVQRYLSGERPQALADSYGYNRRTVLNQLIRLGVPLRGFSEAQALRYADSTPEERAAITSAAHDAARGRERPGDEAHRMALGRERTLSMASPAEFLIADHLVERGLPVRHQTAIGPYNCDLTIGSCSVAVEVMGGGWHLAPSRLVKDRERGGYLMDGGWHLLYVLIDRKRPLRDSLYDEVIAFCEVARGTPAGVRQYRMVGGGGEPLPGLSHHLDPRTLIPAGK
jgi:very-short-patch-repair endonuclease